MGCSTVLAERCLLACPIGTQQSVVGTKDVVISPTPQNLWAQLGHKLGINAQIAVCAQIRDVVSSRVSE